MFLPWVFSFMNFGSFLYSNLRNLLWEKFKTNISWLICIHYWNDLWQNKEKTLSNGTGFHTKKMTKISTIGCTIHLRHKSKQKHTEAQQCIIPPGFPWFWLKPSAVLTLVFCMIGVTCRQWRTSCEANKQMYRLSAQENVTWQIMTWQRASGQVAIAKIH